VHVVDELVSRLAKAGVERIYGIVGDSQNPVTDAVRQNGKLQWIHARHLDSSVEVFDSRSADPLQGVHSKEIQSVRNQKHGSISHAALTPLLACDL